MFKVIGACSSVQKGHTQAVVIHIGWYNLFLSKLQLMYWMQYNTIEIIVGILQIQISNNTKSHTKQNKH